MSYRQDARWHIARDRYLNPNGSNADERAWDRIDAVAVMRAVEIEWEADDEVEPLPEIPEPGEEPDG